MIGKVVKYGLISVVVLAVVGGGLFGTDLISYLSSSARSLRTSVKESVPVEFELQRARDLLDEIVPEMHANIRLIAQEEVEVENLKRDIARCEAALGEGKARIRKLSGMLAGDAAYFTICDRRHPREAVKTELARRFERHKEAEVVLAGKQRLLATREKSLVAAVGMLDKARAQKALLADRIESLAAQHRLVRAASVGSQFQIENSKLAQTDKLIGQIKKRLDVAERVLAHEGRFVEQMEIDVVDEKDLLTQVEEHFGGGALAADHEAPCTPEGSIE
jgi:hypothetical protein